MKITFEGEFEEMREIYKKLFIAPLDIAKDYADQATASASRADSAARNAEMALEEINKHKGESP